MGLITVFIILIVLSAFFSSLETALFHLKSHQKVNKTVRKLLNNPKKLLASLLTGNTIVNISLGSLAAYYTLNNFPNSEYSQSSLLLLEVFIVTVILLIFGEILPKTFAIVKSDKLANLLAKILDIVIKLIYPITFVFLQMTKFPALFQLPSAGMHGFSTRTPAPLQEQRNLGEPECFDQPNPVR